MPYIDWNGSGGLDPQDINTSVVMEVVDDESDDNPGGDESQGHHDHSSASGCLSTMTSIVGVALLVGVAIKTVT
ncbi:MAG: hypothetical protein IJ087_13460 [Eggerthellaceae bacterium]|nr:hypothetical protein [Eggerthellaceae bacterium]